MSHFGRLGTYRYLPVLAGALLLASGVQAQWVEFVDATATVLDDPEALITGDLKEKDYAWGDVDRDGDIDLVIVRKEPFTTEGKEPNVLLINENGVLTDRTQEFASSSDIEGDMGFLTPTNDRDVLLVDLDLDGWLDIVTAPTLSLSDPKHIGHPRIYRNLGCSGACNGTEDWLGFIHEDARIPQLESFDGQSGENPRLCAVSAGDVTGDGYPDLYFSDYDNGVIDQFPGVDFNDKLLVNLGGFNPGFFADVTDARLAGDLPIYPQRFVESIFGAANAMGDLNGDGRIDIVKHSALEVPYYIGVAYNSENSPGFFDDYQIAWEAAPYFVSIGDLNNDGWLDLIVTDDGADRFFINQQTGGAMTEFLSYPFSFSHDGLGFPASDDGFGSNSLAVDIDGDGWNDVLIADVDVDVPGCGGRLNIYRNLGGTPGGVPVLQEQTTGENCTNFFGNPPTCIVAGIPSNKLVGVHDMAVFDIDGDGLKDLVVGRCSGTQFYTQLAPGPAAGATPDGTDLAGQQLSVERSISSGDLTLNWGASCVLGDDDYAVYAGALETIGDHSPVACSTLGSTTFTLTAPATSTYYLIVPNNGTAEGSYGRDSFGLLRQPTTGSCFPQNVASCDG